jgi:hypothetical protein
MSFLSSSSKWWPSAKTNSNGVASFSPALTRSGYAGGMGKMKTTLKELQRGGGGFDATPSALRNLWGRFPRIGAPCLPARTANPGLMDLNPVGIRGENHHLDNPRRNK